MWIYLHSTPQAAVWERSRLQDGAGWGPVQHPPAWVHPSCPQCWPQAPLTELEQPLLQGKSSREPGRGHRVGRDPLPGALQRGTWGALPWHRDSVHGVQLCLHEGFAGTVGHHSSMMLRGSGAGTAPSELPEAHPCSLDKPDLRARSPPTPILSSESTFVSHVPSSPRDQSLSPVAERTSDFHSLLATKHNRALLSPAEEEEEKETGAPRCTQLMRHRKRAEKATLCPCARDFR